MAYIDKILVDGVTYDVQDSIAQQAIAALTAATVAETKAYLGFA